MLTQEQIELMNIMDGEDLYHGLYQGGYREQLDIIDGIITREQMDIVDGIRMPSAMGTPEFRGRGRLAIREGTGFGVSPETSSGFDHISGLGRGRGRAYHRNEASILQPGTSGGAISLASDNIAQLVLDASSSSNGDSEIENHNQEEKEVLRRRPGEYEDEEGETKTLEIKLNDSKIALDSLKRKFAARREKVRSEIFELEHEIVVLKAEEKKKVVELENEIENIASEIDERRKVVRSATHKDIKSCLKCPVCLDVCKPPLQVWQCPEGHIICQSCVERPELRVCPQCRISLTGQLSRNRALEDLARKIYPGEAEKDAGGNKGAFSGRGSWFEGPK